ncbi:MAG: TetR/AcrR family transcriptional regulator [Gammaproteobacteria bacterium]|nr:TetR/AcrR family transcriptional regulator [Gammaproteobacteria bacterium]MDH5802012.1 TetR/AcrR family transcriptional regulator [Gammaproteobacteria bacterium]
MTQDRRSRKKQQTQALIVSVAMDLFRKHGIDTTTMEQIADRSDIAKATLYKYFPVKESIIARYWQLTTQEMSRSLEQLLEQHPDSRNRLRTLLIQSMNAVLDNPELYKIYIAYRMQHIHNPEINQSLRSGNDKLFAQIIEAGQKNGEIRNDIPQGILVADIGLKFFMQTVIWMYHPEDFSAESISDTIVELFLNGAAKRK